ncbi:hypothetical protein EV401DRAFT_1913614 [Pisolithus croceorrhizus]|nr:hypothetical protein EV401DRAFT_1913614 [Pisolithus croceorrhizus]
MLQVGRDIGFWIFFVVVWLSGWPITPRPSMISTQPSVLNQKIVSIKANRGHLHLNLGIPSSSRRGYASKNSFSSAG